MVVLFFIAMISVCLIVDFFIQHRKAKLLPAENQMVREQFNPLLNIKNGLFYGKGHLWNRLTTDGYLYMGIDPFLVNAFGDIKKVSTPTAGEYVQEGKSLLTLENGDKKLQINAPFDATVEETCTRDGNVGFDQWVIKVKPTDISSSLTQFKIGENALKWMKSEIDRFKEFLNIQFQTTPALVLQDGGTPVKGVLQQMDNNILNEFENEFLRHVS